MESKLAFPDALIGKLQRIGDLAEKLVYIKWSQEFFVLLLRAAQDILALARPIPEQQRLVALAERLEQQINGCLEKGELPRGAERERLMAVVDALCRSMPRGGAQTSEPRTHRPIETITTPLFTYRGRSGRPSSPISRWANAPLLWLAAPESASDLVRKLEQRGGFQTRLCASLNEIRILLEQSGSAPAEQPVALLIDLDDTADQPTLFQEIAELRLLLAPEIPLFFLADRGDITARIEAVKAGGAGYFTKPVDIPMLLEALDDRVLKPLSQRILVVDDQLPAARQVARWLESRGMVTQVLAQPPQILPALHNFQPNLLILNLDLKDIDGLDLAQAIQQHELYHELPLVLMSAQTDIGQRLAATGLSGEALLGKLPNPELLFAAVARRLRQGRGLHHKFSQLSHRDTVTNLYNRPYFLAYLERALVATAANAQSAAIMLITLDNLRGLESQDVAAADEVIEQAAKRLQTVLGPDAIAARFGDAVFTALLGFSNQEALPATAQAVQTALETDAYRLAHTNFQLRTSIGISIASPTLREAAVLIQQADLACGMAREGKDARIHVHHAQGVEQDTTSPQQRRLLEEIREAVQQQRMNLLFQPIVSLRGDAVERYEVLLRMRNREGWELLPETVFGLVKRHRIGMVLDRWVIAHSIRVLRERQMRGHSVVLFINISPTILQDEELLNWLQGGLQKTGVPAARLVFEMTETTAELYQSILQPFLSQLKVLGCGVSLDRFSGHERSQALAQALGADYVKLDSRFADDLLNDKSRQAELSQLTRTLGALGMTTVVTGIEDAMTLPVLWSCGIDYVQGFFLQRPHTDMSYDFDQTVLQAAMRIDPVTGLLHAARQAPSPNSDDRPAGAVVELIVIHGISLPPGEFGGLWIDALFTNTLDPAAHPYFQAIAGLRVSAHLLIRRDGEVVQYVPFHRRAWHAGESVYAGRHRCNDFSIGIELEGADHLPYDDRQYPLLATVIRVLWQAYPTITPDRLAGHADIAPGRKTDPGPAFDWSRLRRLLNEARFQDDAPHSERPSVATLASAPLIESQSPS